MRLRSRKPEVTNQDRDYDVGRIGYEAAVMHPRFRRNFAKCLRCRTPWNFVHGHATDYRDGRGMFPLCDECWEDLGTPDARLPFYRVLWEQWHWNESDDGIYEEWEAIEAAVRSGG